MKNLNQDIVKKFKLVLVAFFILSVNYAMSEKNLFQNSPTQITEGIQSDEPFTFYLENVGGQKLLRVSFNGNEGNDGTLTVFNAQNVQVIESNFELIKSPFYATVDVSNLQAGTYTIKLVTAEREHTSTITIQ